MQTKIKALFFDIDGTLVSFKTHKIPTSTIQALQQAKYNGVKVYISTGRPLALITVLDEIKDLIDGYITTNGALCFVGDNEICTHAISKQSVAYTVEQARKNNFCVALIGQKNLCLFQQNDIFNRVFVDLLNICGFNKSVSLNTILQEPILQMTPFITEKQEEQLMSKLLDCQSGRWHPDFTDVTSLRADKGQGLHAMAKYLGLSIPQTMAFGDGGNDLSIIQQAGIGIAMGNAVPKLKQAADYITTTVDEDGVRNALMHYGII